MPRYAQIVGWGKGLPVRVMHNREFEALVDTSDEWIRSRTGIVERRIVGPNESTVTLATAAARQALAAADLDPRRIDLIIVATCTPDTLMPAAAPLVQQAIGATRAGAIDVNAACAGFAYALVMANGMIAAGTYQNILVIGADTLSRWVDWTDRSVCVLFGDGAGAVVLQATDTPTGLFGAQLRADGSGAGLLCVPGGGTRMPSTAETIAAGAHFIHMDGPAVFKFAIQILTESTRDVLTQAGLEVDDIDLFVPHQANKRIIDSAMRAVGIPEDKVFINLDRYGNTSAASIPIALCEAIESGRMRPGDNVLMCGFGAGLTWGTALFQWGVPSDVPASDQWRLAGQSIVTSRHDRALAIARRAVASRGSR